jgi:hypothetical protein
MTRGELKSLYKEWTEDYAARREEDRREREGVPSAVPRENWPSVIAQAPTGTNRQARNKARTLARNPIPGTRCNSERLAANNPSPVRPRHRPGRAGHRS